MQKMPIILGLSVALLALGAGGCGGGGGGSANLLGTGGCPNDALWLNHLVVGPTVSSAAGDFISDAPPAAGMANDGSYVVAWTPTNQGAFGAFFQRYDGDGTAQGGAVRASDAAHFLSTGPAVSMNGSGAFAVAYTPTNQGTFGAYVRLYDSAGAAITSAFRASDPAHFVTTTPAVAMAEDGRFVVAWTATNQGTFASYIQRFSAAGVAQGAVVQASLAGHFVTLTPTLAISATGSFVVAWTATNQGTFASYFQRFTAAGALQGGPTQASTPAHFTTLPPAAAMAPDGRFVIAWLDEGGLFSVFAQAYDAVGVVAGAAVQVNQAGFISDSSLNDAPPPVSAAMNADGNFAIGWVRGDAPRSAFLRRFDETGAPISNDISVSGSETVSIAPALAAARCFDNHVVVWVDRSNFDVEHVLFLADDDGDQVADQCCEAGQ